MVSRDTTLLTGKGARALAQSKPIISPSKTKGKEQGRSSYQKVSSLVHFENKSGKSPRQCVKNILDFLCFQLPLVTREAGGKVSLENGSRYL